VAECRFVVDESSFLIGSLDDIDAERLFVSLNEQLSLCRERSEIVGIISDFDQVLCAPGTALFELLLSTDRLTRDTRLLAYGLLDKCVRLDENAEFVIDPAVVVSGDSFESFGLALAAEAFGKRSAVGVLALMPRAGPGEVQVVHEEAVTSVVIVVDARTRELFYRAAISIDDVGEDVFFQRVNFAFPSLRFAESLSFRRFDGAYRNLRDLVVVHLGALNDRFASAFATYAGMPDQVAAQVGIDLSPEGNTRQSPRLMSMRNVIFQGVVYRCEWHSKLEPSRNRIHFHPGDSGTKGCVLIGIFVDHLPT